MSSCPLELPSGAPPRPSREHRWSCTSQGKRWSPPRSAFWGAHGGKSACGKAGVGRSQDKKHGMLSAPRPEHKGTPDTVGPGTHRDCGHTVIPDTPQPQTHRDLGHSGTPDLPGPRTGDRAPQGPVSWPPGALVMVRGSPRRDHSRASASGGTDDPSTWILNRKLGQRRAQACGIFNVFSPKCELRYVGKRAGFNFSSGPGKQRLFHR